ncbi:hypothetical protein KAT36_03915 [Candidatus Pacearchaeota archaeon]|nr:hypothetical protein [Candidatus Pacearchaeota archaeon]
MVSLKIDVKKRDFVWIVPLVVVLVVGFAVAYNSGASSSVMGHDVDEIDWSKSIAQLKANKICIGSDCRTSWSGAEVGEGNGSSFWLQNEEWLNSIYYNEGRVGIGTSSPQAKLHVVGGDSDAVGISNSALTKYAFLSGNGDIYASRYVVGQKGLCIGSDCRTSWPSGGGGSCLPLAGGKMNSGAIIDNAGRTHLASTEDIYLLARGGDTIVSNAWGGSGNLKVDGGITLGGVKKTSWPSGGAGGKIVRAYTSSFGLTGKGAALHLSCPNQGQYLSAEYKHIGEGNWMPLVGKESTGGWGQTAGSCPGRCEPCYKDDSLDEGFVRGITIRNPTGGCHDWAYDRNWQYRIYCEYIK